MSSKQIADGLVHQTPPDLKKAFLTHPTALTAWESLTPLARNEWLCWIESVKKIETRQEHLRRTIEDLGRGKRRPCCWMGCIHRTDKPMNASQRYILSRKNSRKQ